MDQDTTWYGGRPRSRRHCVRWGTQLPLKRGTAPPLFGPCLLWPNGCPPQLLWAHTYLAIWMSTDQNMTYVIDHTAKFYSTSFCCNSVEAERVVVWNKIAGVAYKKHVTDICLQHSWHNDPTVHAWEHDCFWLHRVSNTHTHTHTHTCALVQWQVSSWTRSILT